MFDTNKKIQSAIEMTEKDGVTRYVVGRYCDDDMITLDAPKNPYQVFFKVTKKTGVTRGYINGVSLKPMDEKAIKQSLIVHEYTSGDFKFMAGWDYGVSPIPEKSVKFYWQGFQITDKKIIQEQWTKMKQGAPMAMITFISEA